LHNIFAGDDYTGVIVGTVIGTLFAIVVMIILVVIIIALCMKKKNTKKYMGRHDSSNEYSEVPSTVRLFFMHYTGLHKYGHK